MRRRTKIIAIIIWSFASQCLAQAGTDNPSGNSMGPIEAKYQSAGPHKVSQITTTAPCDANGNVCDIWYPTDIQFQVGQVPVVLWGNGSDDKPTPPSKYGYLLSHFASWGFVVVATRNSYTGFGQPLLDALAFTKRSAGDPASILYDKLDFEHVAAVGHSQGADGAVNAMLKSDGAITTSIAIELPSERFCNPPGDCVDATLFRTAKQGSLFLITGSRDRFLAPDIARVSNGLNSVTAFYGAFPAALVKVKAVLTGAQHNDVTGSPDCRPSGILLCSDGARGYLGFSTAWLVWQLQGGGEGAAAFGKDTGELLSAHAWQRVLTTVP